MRVTIVEFSPSGGLYQFAVQLADGFASLGHSVRLVTGRRPELLPSQSTVETVAVLPTWHPGATKPEPWALRKVRRLVRAANYVRAWAVVARELRRNPPDVVQWAEWRFILDGWLVTWLARGRRGKAVHADVAHTPRPFSEQRSRGSLYKSGRYTRRALNSAYDAMDVVFVLGPAAQRDVLALWPGVRRVEVVPHADEMALVAGHEIRAVEETDEVVLFFGTLSRYKGLDVLLNAWPRVRAARPTARLVIAGAPADVDVGDIRQRASRLDGIDLRIGYVPIPGVATLYVEARVAVAPHVLAYASGVVALARTCGRPVVASDVGDVAAGIEDGRDGILVPPGSADDLADALISLLADRDLAASIGAAGRLRLVSLTSWTDVARRMTEVYTELLGSGAGR
jgi:glycosyltransferase involved in cell wall biosynthesis